MTQVNARPIFYLPISGGTAAFTEDTANVVDAGLSITFRAIRLHLPDELLPKFSPDPSTKSALMTLRTVDFEIEIVGLEDKNRAFLLAQMLCILLSIKSGTVLHYPFFSSHSFATLATQADGAVRLSRTPAYDTVAYSRGSAITLALVRWANEAVGSIFSFGHNIHLRNALNAYESFYRIPYPETALVVAWTGLEALFALSGSELSFRLSLLIAYFCSDDLFERKALYDRCRQLYGLRSKIAHGALREMPDDLFASAYETSQRRLLGHLL